MLALPGDVKTLPPGQPVRVVGSLLAFEIDTMVLTLAHRSQQVRIRAQLLGPIPIRKGDVWTILGDVAEPQVCSPCACDLFNVPGGRNPHKAFSHREMERWRDGEMEGKGGGPFHSRSFSSSPLVQGGVGVVEARSGRQTPEADLTLLETFIAAQRRYITDSLRLSLPTATRT